MTNDSIFQERLTYNGLRHERKLPEEAYRVFFLALQRGSLHELVKAANLFFGAPVLLTDEHYQLLSIFPKEEIGQQVYDTLLRNKILPKELVVSYQQEYLKNRDRLNVYEPFYADTGQVSDCPRIFGEVYSGKKIFGHFAIMLFDKPLYDTDLECAAIFRDSLKLMMERPGKRDFNSYSTYLFNLLEQDTPKELILFAQEEISKITSGGYALMVTRIGPSASEHAFAAMSTNSLSRNYYEVISTIYEDYLVSLFGSVKGIGRYRDSELVFLSNTAKSLSRAGSSGLSRPFTNLLEIPVRFKEAVLARKAGGGEELSIFYDKMPKAIFCEISEEKNSFLYVHPVLPRILAYDSENATHYYETLKAYSLYLHNKEQTADALHIHRNTLLYRINRIVELFGLPIEERDTALHLINSFQLLDVMALRQRYQPPSLYCNIDE